MSSSDSLTRLPPPTAPRAGAVLGRRFRLEAPLGRGSMGVVYRACELPTGRAVAVKVLATKLLNDGTFVRRFRREARSAASLSHPNVVEILTSAETSNGVPYIVMELLEGRDLARVLREDGPLSFPRVVHILGQVLSGIEAAHARGIVHRDLKPSNIMLVTRGGDPHFVKLCDFGVAKTMLSERDGAEVETTFSTAQGVLCGTPEYMAPEQARGEELDGRTDLYSVGVILYQLITGELPFKAPSALGIVSRHLSEPPKPPSARRPDLLIPPALDALVLRAMAKRREDRPADARAFRQALGAIPLTGVHVSRARRGITRRSSGEMSTAAAPPSRPTLVPPTLPPVRERPRVRPWAITAGLTVTASLAGVLFLSRARTPAPAPVVSVPRASAPPVAPRPPVASAEPVQPPDVRTGSARNAPRPRRAAPSRRGEAPSAVAANDPPRPALDESLRGVERLMSEGRLREACLRGEDLREAHPEAPQVSRFLGRCYMRAGRANQAKEQYRRYLELAPNAPDAAFIRDIVRDSPAASR